MENPSFFQQWKLVSASANYWIIFLPPLAISGFIIWLTLNNINPFDKNILATKNVLEEVALHVTSGFCFLCLLRFLTSKDQFFLWASGMMMVLFIREIHPPIADYSTYISLLWLFYFAYKNHHIFADYLCSRYLVTLLGVGFFTYVLAVTTDERILMRDLVPIPGEGEFHTKLEETLEVIGHIAIGCALLFATKKMSTTSEAAIKQDDR